MDDETLRANYFRANLYNGINLAFLDFPADTQQDIKPQGILLLIHGFPETSYEWRAIIPSLSKRGYRVIAPDYRGAGESSKPHHGFTKASMAADMTILLESRGIAEPVHVVGHNVGAIIAFALALRWPERVASLCLSEYLLPGTNAFEDECQRHPTEHFHFTFHCIENLPEALVSGREKLYIEYFLNKLCYRIGAFPAGVIEHYARSYSQPGAFRSACDLFRAFDKDSNDLAQWLQDNGECSVPTLMLCGEHSSYQRRAKNMMSEVVAEGSFRFEIIANAGHFLPEENPEGFTASLIGFLQALQP